MRIITTSHENANSQDTPPLEGSSGSRLAYDKAGNKHQKVTDLRERADDPNLIDLSVEVRQL